MAGGCAWSRRVGARARTLRALVRDTQRALQEVSDILTVDPEISHQVQAIGHRWTLGTAVVVCGSSSKARVRLLHALLGRTLLPDELPRGCRWIRILYGSSTSVHLSLGNSEFELVEELQCNKKPWDVLPVEDLIRQGPADLTTIIEIELNNQFLKDGLQIVIPPDIDCDPGTSNHLQLKAIHSEFYTKRASIFKTFNPVYLYALEYMGKNIFYDNIGGPNVTIEEDFWSKYSFFNMNQKVEVKSEECRDEKVVWSDALTGREPTVFSAENCLDLHQFRELNPHSQLLFVLLSDASELCSRTILEGEATESAEDRRWAEDLPEADQGILTGIRELESPDNNNLESLGHRERSLYEEQRAFMNELVDQWELMSSPPKKHYVKSQWAILDDYECLRTVEHTTTPLTSTNQLKMNSESCGKDRQDRLIECRSVLSAVVVKFASETLHSYLLEFSTKLSEIHVKLLQQFILASFDMARELQIVPKKIQYVAIQEHHLYQTIHEKFSEGEKKQELVQMMEEVLEELKHDVQHMDWSVDDLPWHQDQQHRLSHLSLSHTAAAPPRCAPPLARSPPSDGEEASDMYLDDYDIIPSTEDSYCSEWIGLSTGSPSPLPSSIPVENESEMTSASSVRTWSRSDLTSCTNYSVSLKHATLDVQQTVLARLSRKISLKLVKFVDCLKETYFGTLQRCIDSLEWQCRSSLCGRPASAAVRQLLSVARQVQLTHRHAYSMLTTLLHSLRRLLLNVRLSSSEAACCGLSAAWRRRVALHAVSGISAHRLARVMSTQILERLSSAHEKYQCALGALEAALANRLHHTEDVRLAIRKKYAPSFARLCLESTSMCDLLMYGTPDLGREIGRGQYGVVYAVRGAWGGRAPLAAKSVLPADTRHYHDLAMEFFYTRSIPPHPRIVPLYGSIVQRSGAGARGVLLVSERKARDLHAAVRLGLAPRARLLIACDIVEGIRYLHSLGLVHRDIKLKNVVIDGADRAALSDLGFCSYRYRIRWYLHSLGLVHRDIKLKNVVIDGADRAALSDLGFCSCRALVSGSVVGTPVHMAPELLNGEYDASVDVYAFGILFWYLCANDVKLPAAFEDFNNKEQLWNKVKKGLRPERLPHFSDECWSIMESCWAADPAQRALPGDIQPLLKDLLRKASDTQPYVYRDRDEDQNSLDMDMSGVEDD